MLGLGGVFGLRVADITGQAAAFSTPRFHDTERPQLPTERERQGHHGRAEGCDPVRLPATAGSFSSSKLSGCDSSPLQRSRDSGGRPVRTAGGAISGQCLGQAEQKTERNYQGKNEPPRSCHRLVGEDRTTSRSRDSVGSSKPKGFRVQGLRFRIVKSRSTG